MPGKEYDPTNQEGRGKDRRKGLPSGNDASKEEISHQDTRGDALMAETALKKRVAKKQKQEAKTPEAPPSQIRKEAKPKSIFLESLVRQHVERARNMVLMRHIEELQAENKAYKEKEEHRKEQQRKRAAKWRDSHPETHKERERERYRSRNAEN